MKQLQSFFLIFFIFAFAACIKDEDTATGVGDALIVTKKSGNNTVYGISLYAYTFSSFKTVKAVSTADATKTYTLAANQGYKTNFYYETPDAAFATTKPAAATFNFSATFENGATHEFQDVLSDKVLGLPVIEKCTYNKTTGMLDVAWTALTNADSYAINILDGTTLVFGSPELASTVKAYSISVNGGGWASGFTPVSGKTYTLKLYAFLYESGGNSYNVQSTSVSETPALWGDQN